MKTSLVVAALVVCVATPAALAGGKKKTVYNIRFPISSNITATTEISVPLPEFNISKFAGNIPFIGDIKIIKIHIPVQQPPQNGTGSNSGSPTKDGDLPGANGNAKPPAAEPPQDPKPLEGAGSPEAPAKSPAPEYSVAIPDITTFDAVFANHSRLSDNIHVFSFGGVFEIVIHRTNKSVDVVMVRQNDTRNGTSDEKAATDSAVPASNAADSGKGGLLLAMRAPSVSESRHGDEKHKGDKADDSKYEDEDEDEDENEDEKDTNSNGDEEEEKDELGRGHGTLLKLTKGGATSVLINHSSVANMPVGVVKFNSSGMFKMNVSMGKDMTTVTISQITGGMPGGKGAPAGFSYGISTQGLFAAPAGSGSTEQGPSGLPTVAFTLLALVAACSVAMLGTVLLRSRARAWTRVSTLAQRVDDYGSFEHAPEAVHCERTSFR